MRSQATDLRAKEAGCQHWPGGQTPTRRAWRSLGGASAVWLFLGWLTGSLFHEARAAVGLTLRIPEAQTWVLGDAIPLYWRFSNQSTQALGFMWEGCCRLNGQLSVSTMESNGRLEMLPPGQALAHMFAKADRLEPGIAKEYDTKVSDWILLPGTGQYRLQGTYRGVLPTQFPQVQRGLSLWRDAALSPAVELSILSVADYLAQREERERRRGWRMTLTGPNRLSPLTPATFRVRLEPLGASANRLKWPDDLTLWVVDAQGRRRAPMAVITAGAANQDLPPTGGVDVAFVIAPDRFEGEPLDDYSVFVDLAEGGEGRPRVPSNMMPLSWRWGADEVENLVREASRGAGTGGRNASLKMLRVYLGDVGPDLERLDRSRLDPGAAGLADRLLLAARLRPLSPRPGAVGLAVAVRADGGVAWGDPRVAAAFRGKGADFRAQLQDVVAVRRHLGWELTPVLVPTDDAPLAAVLRASDQLNSDATEWAGAPGIQWQVGTNTMPARLIFKAAAEGATLRDADGGLRGQDLRAQWLKEPPGPVTISGATPWASLQRQLDGLARPGELREILVARPTAP